MDSLFHELPSGLRLEITSQVDFYLYKEFFCERSYDRALDYVMAYTKPQSSFAALDLGCNVGYFTTLLADCLSARNVQNYYIEGIDASERNLKEFKRRLEAQVVDNLVDHIGYTRGAVGYRHGFTFFHEDPFHTMSRTHKGSEQVAYVIPRNLDWDLIKCDIEGSEENFIENFPDVLAKTKILIVEFHDELVDSARCRKLLNEYGLTRRIYEPRGTVSLETFSRL